MAIFAILDLDGVIVNRIVLDADSDWQPPEGHSVIEENGQTSLKIGGRYIVGEYTPPTDAPEQRPVPVDLSPAEKLAAAGLSVDDLKSLLGIK